MANGVGEGFTEFYRHHYPRLVRDLVVHGFQEQIAKDAAQQAMIDAYKQWENLTNPLAWARTAAVRYAGRERERDRRRLERDRSHQQAVPTGTLDSAERQVERSEEASAVLQVISAMPSRRRDVVALAFDGWKVEEIADKLGMQPATVRSHLRHARRALREKGEAS